MSGQHLVALTSLTSLMTLVVCWARARVAAVFFWRHGRLPKMSQPQSYNEWVQWRKLNDRDHSLALLTDKLHSKALAADLVGEWIVIPTLWRGDVLPEVAAWPMPFVLKSNHGCKQFAVVRTEEEWRSARALAPRWLSGPYGQWLDEWHYGSARRTLLIEPFIGPASGLPVDYKIFVFGGRAEFIQVHLDRAGDHRWVQFDRDWVQLSAITADDIGRPLCLQQMLDSAEAIAGERDHLRVDFYEVDGRLWFGELCLFPGSGLERFNPAALDEAFGRPWAKARAKLAIGAAL